MNKSEEKLADIAVELDNKLSYEDIVELDNKFISFNTFALLCISKHVLNTRQIGEGLYFESENGTHYVIKVRIRLIDNKEIYVLVNHDDKGVMAAIQLISMNVKLTDLEIVCKRARSNGTEYISISEDFPCMCLTDIGEIMNTVVNFYDSEIDCPDVFYTCNDLKRNFARYK